MTQDNDKVIITAAASPFHRVFAVLVMGALGVLLIVVAGDAAFSLAWQAIYIALGLGAIYGAWRLWNATGAALELTRTELRSTTGQTLATLDNVARVDRGAFAFKPSNGFVVSLKTGGQPRAWAPGLWWRVGRRIGVGGVVSAGEAKAMAEVMTALVTGVLPEEDLE